MSAEGQATVTLTAEQREALDAARTMTPLTLYMVVAQIVAEHLIFSRQTTTNVMQALAESGSETAAAEARADAAEQVDANVRALADEWKRELDTGAIRDPGARYCWSTAERELRALLPTAPTGDQGGEAS